LERGKGWVLSWQVSVEGNGFFQLPDRVEKSLRIFCLLHCFEKSGILAKPGKTREDLQVKIGFALRCHEGDNDFYGNSIETLKINRF